MPMNLLFQSKELPALVVLTSFCYLLLLLAAGTPILADWLNKRW
jgi:hypothetical protein